MAQKISQVYVMSFNNKQVAIKLIKHKLLYVINILSKLLTQCVRKCRQKGLNLLEKKYLIFKTY